MELHIHIAPGVAQAEPIHVTLPESMVSTGGQTGAAVALQPSAPEPPESVPAPVAALSLVPEPAAQPEPAPATDKDSWAEEHQAMARKIEVLEAALQAERERQPEPAPAPEPAPIQYTWPEPLMSREEFLMGGDVKPAPAPIEYTECEVVCTEHDRPGWLLARKDSVGASEGASVLGVEGAFGSELSVYADKRSEVDDTPPSEPQRWGTLLEPVILKEYARQTGRELFPGGTLLRSLERPWQSCTLDAGQRVEGKPGPGGVEVKCTSWRSSDWDGGVPAAVNVQVQHQMAVTGWQWTTVIVLFHGNEMKWLDVERDDAFINDILIPAERKFWDCVEAGTPPDPDETKASSEAIKRLWPTPEPGTVVDLDDTFKSRDEARETANRRIKKADTDKRGAENAIRAAIGEHEAGRLSNGVVYTHKKDSRGARRLNRVAAKGGK